MARKVKAVKKVTVHESQNGKTYVSGLMDNPLTQGSVVSRVEEIEQEKAADRRAPKPDGMKPVDKKMLFDTQLIVGHEQNEFIHAGMAKFFGFEACGFRENIKRWDFPLAIGDKFKHHVVYRQYFYKQIMVDAFEPKTPKSEILRIKAHLEALKFKYTYIIGGEVFDPKVVFKKRLKPLDPKSKDYPKFQLFNTLEEAGYAGHSGTVQ